MRRKSVLRIGIVLCLMLLSGCSNQAQPALEPSDSTTAVNKLTSKVSTTTTTKRQKTTTKRQKTTTKQQKATTKQQKATTKQIAAQSPVRTQAKATTEAKPQPIPNYTIGQTWRVEGQWELTFTAATRHYFCNEFEDSDSYHDCVILTYDYKNIGYADDLYFSGISFDVFDGNGEAADRYPCIDTESAKSCPSGMKCSGAQEAYQLKGKSDYITVVVSYYTEGNFTEEKQAKFVLKITEDTQLGFPSDVETYSEFPYAPDFGAMLGIDYDVIYNDSSDMASYAYYMSSVQAVDKTGSSGGDYVRLLTKCGYTDQGTVFVDGVEFYRYYNAQYSTTVQFGANDTFNAIIVVVFK